MPLLLRSSYVGLLLLKFAGSLALRLPAATNTCPFANVWADAYHLFEANLLLFSSYERLFPSILLPILNQRIASSPSSTVSSTHDNGPFPPTVTTDPSARKDPPQQNGLVVTETGLTRFVTGL